jgi:AhpD family alkylhydroperoxidase
VPKDTDMTQRLDYEAVAAEGVRALGGVHHYVAKSGLPLALIDMTYLRVSQINGCPYCIDMHTRDAMKHGVAVEKLMLVSAWRDTGALFSPQERAALQWAEGFDFDRPNRRARCRLSGGRRAVRREGSRRPDHRDRPDERLQPHCHRLPPRTGHHVPPVTASDLDSGSLFR